MIRSERRRGHNLKTQIDFVESVAEKSVVVQCASQEHKTILQQFGGKQGKLKRRQWTFEYDGEGQLADLLAKLRDLGIALAGGSSGWPPAAVFESLREKGKISGQFKELPWKGKDEILLLDR